MDRLEKALEVLYDQAFVLESLQRFLEADGRGFSVRDALASGDSEFDDLFLSRRELTDVRDSLLRFEDYDRRLHCLCLHGVCLAEKLLYHVFVDDRLKEETGWSRTVVERVANVQDADALFSERLLFDFAWQDVDRAKVDLGAILTFLSSVGADACLPEGVAHAAIPCSRCRFDAAFAEDQRALFAVDCPHYCAPWRESRPRSTTTTTTTSQGEEEEEEELGRVACRRRFSIRFPSASGGGGGGGGSGGAGGVFGQVLSEDEFCAVLKDREKKRGGSGMDDDEEEEEEEVEVDVFALAQLKRDCVRERENVAETGRMLERAAGRTLVAEAPKGIAVDFFARLVQLVESMTTREVVFERLWRETQRRRRRGRRRGHGDDDEDEDDDDDDDVEVDVAVRNRVRKNMESMIVQRGECEKFVQTFNHFSLEPLANAQRGMHRKDVDMRKFMFALGISPVDIQRSDERAASVDNKTVFFFDARGPADRLFRATFVASLFVLYLRDTGVAEQFLPSLCRADEFTDDKEEEEEEEEEEEDAATAAAAANRRRCMIFGVGDEWVLAAFGRRVARAKTDDILKLCVRWIEWLLTEGKAGDATESLRYAMGDAGSATAGP